MTAGVEISPSQVIAPERRAKAEERAGRIRAHLASAAEEYAAAIIEEDWRALGFACLEEWRSAMFGAQRLTVEARRQVAELLSAEGKTLREIGTATGTSEATAHRDLQSERTAPDQAVRHETVTRKSRPKSPAERAKGYRDRRKVPGGQSAAGPVAQPVAVNGTTGEVPRVIRGLGKMPVTAPEWEEADRQFAKHAEKKLGEEHRREVARLERERDHWKDRALRAEARVTELEAAAPVPAEPEAAPGCSHLFPWADDDAGEQRCTGCGQAVSPWS